MKGKNIFTKSEMEELKRLIKQRTSAEKSEQKSIRNKFRKIGFYGRDDYGIIDLQLGDLENLIKSKRIRVVSEMDTTSLIRNSTITYATKHKNTNEEKSSTNFILFDP